LIPESAWKYLADAPLLFIIIWLLYRTDERYEKMREAVTQMTTKLAELVVLTQLDLHEGKKNDRS
jgi:hypothetical protein